MLRLYVTPEYRTCSCQVSAEVNLSDDLSDDQNAAMHSYHMHARNLILHAGSKTAGTCLQPYSYSQLEGGGGGMAVAVCHVRAYLMPGSTFSTAVNIRNPAAQGRMLM